MENDKIAELEKRIKILEEKFEKLIFSDAKEVSMTGCAIGALYANQASTLNVTASTISSVFNNQDTD